jgi:hypothetical protein
MTLALGPERGPAGLAPDRLAYLTGPGQRSQHLGRGDDDDHS